MELREYTSDLYPVICEWWTAHGWPAVPESFLSKTGLIAVDADGVARAAFWLYRTDSPVLIGEWLVVNPKNSSRESYEAVTLLADSAVSIAEGSGSYFLSFLQSESLIKMFRLSGFEVESAPHTVVHYVGKRG